MTRADIATLRARACVVMAALGDVLDSLTVIEQTIENASDDFADAVVILQHLDEARTTGADLCESAHTVSLALDMAQQLQVDRVAEIEGSKRGGS